MKSLNSPAISLILGNLIVLGFALYSDWHLSDFILIFWTENLIIGFYALIKILTSQGKPESTVLQLFPKLTNNKVVLFITFLICFSFFCLLQIIFMERAFHLDSLPTVARFDHSFIPQINWLSFLPSVIVLLITHGISFIINYIGKKEYKIKTPKEMWTAPFKRVFFIQITMILVAVAMPKLGLPAILITLLFFAAKIGIDLWRHKVEHKI